MRMWILCLMWMTMGCGKDIPRHTNPDFIEFIEWFKVDAREENVDENQLNKVTVIDYDINLDGKEELAKCFFKSDVENKYGISLWSIHWHEIRVSYEWNKLDKETKYKVLLHEIGHCAYHLRHNFEDLNAIMAPGVTNADSTFELEKHLFFMDVLKNKKEWDSEEAL